MPAALPRAKRAELASGIGALVLGLGLGAVLARYIGRFDLALVAFGAFVHGWGMLDKRRLEREAGTAAIWWNDALYWVCWAGLAGLVGYLVLRAALG
jgi:hypothetical protein